MTTVLDPFGTPTIIYNSSGKNIQNIIANAGTAFANAVAITHVSEESVVFVDTTGGIGSGAVYFASGFDLGDTVRVISSGGAFLVYNNSGSPRGNLTSNPFGKFLLLDPSTQNWQPIG